jgi:TRAP-type C4-dicarboxylate transport system permease small subunit
MSLLTTPRVFGQGRGFDLSNRQRILGIVCRSIFMIVLLIVAARVSAPQHVGSSWLDIPSGDLIRAIVGFGFCLWVLVHIFILPKDAGGYRTWTYLGAALIPLALICGFAVW